MSTDNEFHDSCENNTIRGILPRHFSPHMNRLFLLLFAAAIACAQTPGRAAPETLDPIALAAARDLLESMRFRFTLAADMKAASSGAEEVLRQIVTQKVNGDPTLSPAARSKALAALDKMMPEAVDALQGVFTDPATADEISKETARIYARTFTPEELVEIAKFYKTPTGAKLLGMSSRIHAESLAFGRRYMAPRIDRLVEEMMKKSATPDQPTRKDAK